MAKKETQQRVLVIKNFKNIGVSQMDSNYNLSDKLEKLVLNTSYKGDHHGGLVTIIGENNTGKSNVSGAIDKFAFKDETTFNENDFPNFSNYEACEPDLNLMLRDYTQAAATNNGGGGAKYVSHTLATMQQQNGEMQYKFCNNKETLKAAIRIYTKTLLDNKDFDSKKVEILDLSNKAKESKTEKELLAIYSKLKNMETNSVEILKAKEKYQNDIKQAYNELLESANNIIEEFELEVDDYGIFSCIQDTYREQWQTIKNNIKSSKDYDKMIQAYKEMQNFIQKVSTEYKKEDDDMWEKEFDFIIPKNIKDPTITKKYENVDEVLEEVFEDSAIESESKDSLFLPQIFNYNDMTDEFKNDDLIVSLDKLSESRFFQSLFNAINQPMFSVLNAYKKAKTTPAFLSNQERVINERIKNIVTKRFNELFGKNDKNGYDFEIRLEEHRISFAAYKINGEGVTDRDVLILEQQSTGFKWFFNLYFNLLNGKILKSGDIVLMDEPAHNLSPKARKECAEFLRKYGEENGITFVIVTHDLFWIDSDFLNEVRIIKNREDKELKGVSIQNDFSRIQSSDTDTFLEIKRAFGVDMHVFYPPNVRLVFVEGITDYNYLSAFKLLLQKERNEELDIVFLPICGLGKDSSEKAIVLEKLMGQCKDPILLVDSDEASKEIESIKQEKGYDKLDIIKLSEIDSKFKEIESLFSKKDYEKYGLEKKSSGISSAFKKHILWAKDDENAKDERLEKTTKDNFYKVLEHLLKNL
ncbi:hypothetical protein C826_00134 [Helicobacter bilis WiWa]|uniref:ATPase AAA-type core domain-containing protein n=2 Tax=Helicobacter bilis TaxID=37372 RepID=N2BW30_9HELI|nr:AAA family ATPase [Helicobacter bilis]EMZ41124.1 hypothetical protein C826_00134 [Helicobacter bilis WiWa]